MTKNKQKYQNSRTLQYINDYPETIVETAGIAPLLKFNLKFLEVNQKDVGFCALEDLTDSDREMQLDKMKWFSTESRFTWETKPTGRGERPLLVVYDNIPGKSKAKHPKNVPSDVSWARFRLEGRFRLVGFFIPDSLDKCPYKANGREYYYDRNTFYVVFLDPNHNFYPV